MAMAELPGPYDVRAYACVARGVATHTCTMAPYRGVSRPVITFAIERLMDKAAAAFDLGPDEIRRRNLIRNFPYTSATGLVFDEGSYIETLEQAIAHVDLKSFPRAATRRAHARPLSRHRLCDFFRAHRLRQPGLRRARHGDHAGLGDRRNHHGPVRRRRSAHRRQPARARPAHHACPNHRRPSRRRAAARAHRARRHRPHALWLGHVRQPLAGHCRRRVIVGGAKDPQKTAHHRQPCVGGRNRRHRARKRPRQSFGNRSHRDDRDTGPCRLSSNPPVQRRDHAGLERKRRLRSARHLLQCLPRRHRRGRYRDRPRRKSKNFSRWRMPAASSIR